MPIISVLRMLRQEDCCKLKASLGYMETLYQKIQVHCGQKLRYSADLPGDEVIGQQGDGEGCANNTGNE